jgi:hypothetical protein
MKVKRKETTRYRSMKSTPELQSEGLNKEQGGKQGHRQASDGLNARPSGTAGVGRLWGCRAGRGRRRDRRRGQAHRLGAESVEGVCSVGGSVDREYHSAGTVGSLRTVNPNGLGVVHGDGESGEGGSVSANRHAG